MVTYFFILATTVIARAPKVDAGVNLQLFWTYREVFSRPRGSHGLNIEILLNILMMIPVGYLLPSVMKTKLSGTIILGISFSVMIELLQWITRRGLCELDDVLNNTVGILLGYGVYWLWKRKKLATEEKK